MAWQAVAELKGETGSFSFTGPSGSVLFYDGSSVTGSTYFSYDPAGLGKLTVAGTIDPIYMTLTTSSTGTTGYSPESTLWYGPTGGGTGLGALYVGNVPIGVGSNFIKVDSVWGNDTLAATNKYQVPFKTVSAGLSGATSGDTVFIYPGTYWETAPLTLPSGVALRGANVQTAIIGYTGATASTALIVSGSGRVEDLTLNAFAGDSGMTMIGLEVMSPQNFKLRTAVVNVDGCTGSHIYGVYCNTSGSTAYSTSDIIRSCTIKTTGVTGDTLAYGVYMGATGIISLRDTNIYSSGGSDAKGGVCGSTGGILAIRYSSIFGSSADISQDHGSIVLGHSELINHSANGKGFGVSTAYANIIFGSTKNISGSHYLLPGTIPSNELSATVVTSYFPQDTLVRVVSARANSVAGTCAFRVYKGSTATPITGLGVTLTNANLFAQADTSSEKFTTTDAFILEMISSGGNTDYPVVDVSIY